MSTAPRFSIVLDGGPLEGFIQDKLRLMPKLGFKLDDQDGHNATLQADVVAKVVAILNVMPPAVPAGPATAPPLNVMCVICKNQLDGPACRATHSGSPRTLGQK